MESLDMKRAVICIFLMALVTYVPRVSDCRLYSDISFHFSCVHYLLHHTYVQ